MTYPRSHLVDAELGGCYHVVSRCVRRAWLCGHDSVSGRNFDHRRRWIEDRIHMLSHIFAVSIYSYAVMSNHYHIALKVEPKMVDDWSDEQVAEKWLSIYPGRQPRKPDPGLHKARKTELLDDPQRLAELRSRLGSLSWFMRSINEPLARWANDEDGCTGRFWEGRFVSQILLDEMGLLACMVYIDLNPLRAGIATDLADSKHTSGRHRISLQASRQQLAAINREPDEEDTLSYLTVADYLELARWTAGLQGKGAPKDGQGPVALNRPGIDEDDWLSKYLPRPNHWQRAIGSDEALTEYARTLGLCWIKRRARRRSSG